MKTAVVGLGIGLAHVAGYLRHPGAELVAVADAWEERRRGPNGTFAQGSMGVLKPLFQPPEAPAELLGQTWEELGCRVYQDIAQVVADPEIELVSLCTPDDTHAAMATAILKAGKHLLLEKPVALTLEDALDVQRAAINSPGRLAIGYEFRVNPAVRALAELVHSGSLGRVRAFSLYHFRTPFRRDKWQNWIQDRQRSGGLVVEETCHWFDLLRFITGQEVQFLTAVGTGDIHPDFNYEDIAYIQGRLTDDGIFQISHALTGHDFSLVIQAHGTEGSAWCGLKEESRSSLDNGESTWLGVLSHGHHTHQHHQAPENTVTTWGLEATEPWNIRQQTMETVDAINSGRPFPAETEDGILSLRIALAARRALETGKAETP